MLRLLVLVLVMVCVGGQVAYPLAGLDLCPPGCPEDETHEQDSGCPPSCLACAHAPRLVTSGPALVSPPEQEHAPAPEPPAGRDSSGFSRGVFHPPRNA